MKSAADNAACEAVTPMSAFSVSKCLTVPQLSCMEARSRPGSARTRSPDAVKVPSAAVRTIRPTVSAPPSITVPEAGDTRNSSAAPRMSSSRTVTAASDLAGSTA